MTARPGCHEAGPGPVLWLQTREDSVHLRPELESLRGSRPRISVFRSGGLGDTILLVPALRVLARELPDAALTLVGSSWAHAIQPLLPFPVEVVSFDSSALTPLFNPGTRRDPSGLLAGADAVVVFSPACEGALAANARALGPDRVIERSARPDGADHASVHLARAFLAGPLDRTDLPAPGLVVPPHSRGGGRDWLRNRFGPDARPAAVHPGSGAARKCWPPERFAEVIHRTEEPVLLPAGPADREAAHSVLHHAGSPPRLQVARALAVEQVAALLAECRWFLGNDSGLSHLAAGLDVPTVAVFGPTDPDVWSPRGPVVRVVRPRTHRDWPDPEAVLQALASLRNPDR